MKRKRNKIKSILVNNNQEKINLRIFKYECLKFLDVSIIILNEIIKNQTCRMHKIVSEEDYSKRLLRHTEVLSNMQLIKEYTEVFYLRILEHEGFVKELHEAVTNPIQRNDRKYSSKSNNTCEVCENRLSKDNHHLIPLVYGGSNKQYNLVSVCKRCHNLDPYEIFANSFKTIIEHNEKEKNDYKGTLNLKSPTLL